MKCLKLVPSKFIIGMKKRRKQIIPYATVAKLENMDGVELVMKVND